VFAVANNKLREASGSNSGVVEDSDLLDVTPRARFGISYDPQTLSGEASRKIMNSLRSFETSGNTHPATDYHIAEDQNPVTHTTHFIGGCNTDFIRPGYMCFK
jgi:hypothetical protein